MITIQNLETYLFAYNEQKVTLTTDSVAFSKHYLELEIGLYNANQNKVIYYYESLPALDTINGTREAIFDISDYLKGKYDDWQIEEYITN